MKDHVAMMFKTSSAPYLIFILKNVLFYSNFNERNDDIIHIFCLGMLIAA